MRILLRHGKFCTLIITGLVFVSGLLFAHNVNATSHEYLGIPYALPQFPCSSVYDSTSGKYVIDWSISNPSSYCSAGGTFGVAFEGDAYDSSFDDLHNRYSQSFMTPVYDSSTNKFNYESGVSSIYNIFSIQDSYNSLYPSAYVSGAFEFVPTLWTGLSASTVGSLNVQSPYGGTYGSISVPEFNYALHDLGIMSCDNSNGAVCGGLWNTSEYISSQILPYRYTSDGFYTKNSAVSEESGFTYSWSFRLASLFDKPINKFSHLQVPLWDYDNFFWSDEMYNGRDIEFKGAFEFDGSFSWHENINSNGSHFQVILYSSYVSGGERYDETIPVDCSVNLITLSNLTRLEYSCPYTLTRDYLWVLPMLDIDGNGNYVWVTNDEWRFAYTYLITDNDDTSGSPFNSHLTGGGTIIGSDEFILDLNEDDDWFSHLTTLFDFTFINPFTPIFGLFTNQNQCASIPTLSSMLHFEEGQVCPWFSASTRSIVTPVIGLFSMMLLFGFVIHWINSSSGNFFEDTQNEVISSVNGSPFRRYKK